MPSLVFRHLAALHEANPPTAGLVDARGSLAGTWPDPQTLVTRG